jgi:hypothetical protein
MRPGGDRVRFRNRRSSAPDRLRHAQRKVDQGGGKRHQAADLSWISPCSATRTASANSAAVKRGSRPSRATTRSRNTPRFSAGTLSAAVMTAASWLSLRASIGGRITRKPCRVMISCLRLLSTQNAFDAQTAKPSAARSQRLCLRPPRSAFLGSNRGCRTDSEVVRPASATHGPTKGKRVFPATAFYGDEM